MIVYSLRAEQTVASQLPLHIFVRHFTSRVLTGRDHCASVSVALLNPFHAFMGLDWRSQVIASRSLRLESEQFIASASRAQGPKRRAPEPRLPARPRLEAALHRRYVLIPHPAAVERRAMPALWVAEPQAEREGRFVPHGSRGRCVACVGLSLRRRRRMQPAENSRRMLSEGS